MQLGQDGVSDSSLFNSVGFLSNRLKIVSCCYDEMHIVQSDIIVYSCFITHRCMHTCMLGYLMVCVFVLGLIALLMVTASRLKFHI